MALTFRLALPADYPRIQQMVLESFEPITWQRKLDQNFGPLNGADWRQRWHSRMQAVFQTQVVLVGEAEGEIAAMASGTLDPQSAMALIDLLAVDQRHQGRGCGREMLRGMIEHMRNSGARYIQLDCLTDNDRGNALYRSEGFQEVARHIRWFRSLE